MSECFKAAWQQLRLLFGQRKVLRLYALLGAMNLVAWGLALAAFANRPVLIGTALLAYTFGLRHAVDADHISAIDNVTRKLMQDGRRPVGVGFFFSLGHSTIVIALSIAIAIAAGAVKRSLPELQAAGGLVGTGVSAAFLLLIAAINAVVLAGVLRALRELRRTGTYHECTLDGMLDRRGLIGRCFRPLFRLVDRSWKMYPLGVLFGLGFDTATEVGLLGIAAVEAGKGLPVYDILIFPLLFTAGMSLLDATDGVLMLGAYGWAFIKPVRKLYYNVTVTSLSVVVAALVGGIEAGSVIAAQRKLTSGPWAAASVLSIHLGTIGFAVVGIFVAAWIGSTIVYREGRAAGHAEMPRALRSLIVVAAILSLVGCSFGASQSSSGRSFVPLGDSLRIPPSVSGLGKIQHVVIIIQENRSFDDMFQGYPGADTVPRGQDSKGRWITLKPVSLKDLYIVDHSSYAMFADCNGTGPVPGTQCQMNGFDQEAVEGGPVRLAQYVYVPHAESKPYFDMAHEWVLTDRTFASQLDESFVAHQYLIAAQAHSSVNVPLGKWGCGGGKHDFEGTILADRTYGNYQLPCFDYKTLGDELDAAGLPWHFYTSQVLNPSGGPSGLWSAYQAIRHIRRGPDWKQDILTPQSLFLTQVPHGKLAAVTWITPLCEDSDHVACGGGYGPSWVASLVNAVGKSKFWDSTAIFVLWDDWGGMYDHVPPPYRDYDGNGFRIPLLVISPYAKRNYVSHTVYETASILTFAEDVFGLSRLSAADARATSPAADCFDFSQPPRRFVPIKAPKGPGFFLHQPNDFRPPDYE